MEPTPCRRDRIRHQAMRDLSRTLLRMPKLRWFGSHAHQKSGASCIKTHSGELCLQIGWARQIGPVHRDGRTRTGGKLCTAIGQKKNNGTCVANTLRAHCERFYRPCKTGDQTRYHPKTLLFINSGPTLSLFAVFHRPWVPSDARARGSAENAASSTSPREALIAFQTLGQSTTTHNLAKHPVPFLSGHHGMATKFRGMYASEHMEGMTLHMLVSEFGLGATADILLLCRLHRIRFRDSQYGTFALTSLNAHDKQTLTKETCVHPSMCNIRHHERLQRNT